MKVGISDKEIIAISDQIRFLDKLYERQMNTLLAVEKIKTEAFSSGKVGRKSKTTNKLIFLKLISEEIGTTSREALAAWAAEKHAKESRRLWGRFGYEKLQLKILNFIKNYPIK